MPIHHNQASYTCYLYYTICRSRLKWWLHIVSHLCDPNISTPDDRFNHFQLIFKHFHWNTIYEWAIVWRIISNLAWGTCPLTPEHCKANQSPTVLARGSQRNAYQAHYYIKRESKGTDSRCMKNYCWQSHWHQGSRGDGWGIHLCESSCGYSVYSHNARKITLSRWQSQ